MNATQSSDPPVSVRPTRGVRLIEQAGVVVAYPEPHRTPVLPRGWAPLSEEQQDAVLDACDMAPQCVVFRVGSVWEPDCEFRVYRLTSDLWSGLSVTMKSAGTGSAIVRADGAAQAGAPCRRQLLGLSHDPVDAIRIAIDFLNWDLEAHGQSWRLGVRTPAGEHS